MREGLHEPVSVVWYYNAKKRSHQPHVLTWNNRDYYLGKIDFWHKTWDGKYQVHHFSVADREGQTYFKLCFHTDNLQWTLEEYMSGHDAHVMYRKELA